MDPQQRSSLASWCSDRVKWDVDMAEYSTLRAGGKVAALVDVQNLEELSTLLAKIGADQIPCRVIGRGSNILVAEQGFSGVILRLKGTMNEITLQADEQLPDEVAVIRVGAGCSMAACVSWCTRQGLRGLEFMTGIPGSVGGAVWMNAGAWGGEIGQCLHVVEFADFSGQLHRVDVAELSLSYRKLAWPGRDLEQMVIVAATFGLQHGSELEIRKQCRSYLEQRRGKQPAGVASAGSFFKNPQGDSAGRLIEAAGLKGVRCGQAMVSPMHANFIVNTGRATAGEIIALMEQVQETVQQKFGVRLEPEVRILQG